MLASPQPHVGWPGATLAAPAMTSVPSEAKPCGASIVLHPKTLLATRLSAQEPPPMPQTSCQPQPRCPQPLPSATQWVGVAGASAGFQFALSVCPGSCIPVAKPLGSANRRGRAGLLGPAATSGLPQFLPLFLKGRVSFSILGQPHSQGSCFAGRGGG